MRPCLHASAPCFPQNPPLQDANGASGASCCVYDGEGKLLSGTGIDSSHVDGLEVGEEEEKDPLLSLSIVDRLLAVWILLAMVRDRIFRLV